VNGRVRCGSGLARDIRQPIAGKPAPTELPTAVFRERDRRGNGRLLGRRSVETEATLAAFMAGKQAAAARFAAIEAQMEEQARLNKALRLARVPRVIARILREIDRVELAGSFSVLGTQALHAYESLAGVQYLSELLASGDIDLLYDTRRKLTVVADKLDGEGLLGLLKKADRSFECIRKRGFRAANAGQFMVDLIIAPRGMRETSRRLGQWRLPSASICRTCPSLKSSPPCTGMYGR
jgi:hypothetical protein